MDQIPQEVKVVEIEEEMKKSYIDYAMSVIVGRALPDARDGLKPVHRRILYAMYDMGTTPDRPYKKCARIVGEVLGKYHPHGDVAVYDTLVRMAQDFSSREPLVDGHGNFGSVDGDAPAAMRYTEARLSPLAMELLRDIDKETVDFVFNFDDTLMEPVVLPARFPNLLVNGSAGIAVGMATNIPPHNLGEVIDGVILLIDQPEATLKEILKVIKGPDFPTGGIILGRRGIRESYEKGRGTIRVRGKAQIEETKSGRAQIVVTELPYQVNKARLAEKIAELARDKKIAEISDLRDESDRTGMRLVIELKRDCVPQVALNKLFKHTQLETTYGINFLALVDGIPRTLSLIELLKVYLNHQKEVIRRRTQFELTKAKKRIHILEGLLVALSHLDEVISLIKSSREVAGAREKLMARFGLSVEQAQAILEMRLQRLTQLESKKIQEEHEELSKQIVYLKEVLASEGKILGIIKEELLEVKKKFSSERLTKITASSVELEAEDLIAEEDVIITISGSGYVKRIPLTAYRRQGRGGKGVIGATLKEGDYVAHLFIASTHDYLLLFSNQGKVYRLKIYDLPSGSRTSRGQALINLIPLVPGEQIVAGIAIKSFEQGGYLAMTTKKGMIKKTALKDYHTSRRDGILAIALREKDELVEVKLVSGEDEVILVTKNGQSIRFNEKEVRSMGRVSLGVKGMRLSPDDEVLGMVVVQEGGELLAVTEKGFGKRTPFSSFPKQRRGGKGVRAIKLTPKLGKVVGVKGISGEEELFVISTEGQVIRISTKAISRMGRHAQGVKIMRLKESDQVSALAKA